MDNLTVTIDDRELREQVAALGSKLLVALDLAARAGAQPVVALANQYAPEPVVTSRISKVTVDSAEIEIGVPRSKYVVAIFEVGAQPHEIDGKKKKALAFAGADGAVVRRAVGHPGMAARPFLRPALDAGQGQAVEAAGKALREIVEGMAR